MNLIVDVKNFLTVEVIRNVQIASFCYYLFLSQFWETAVKTERERRNKDRDALA